VTYKYMPKDAERARELLRVMHGISGTYDQWHAVQERIAAKLAEYRIEDQYRTEDQKVKN
jgi:hypothetical protein